MVNPYQPPRASGRFSGRLGTLQAVLLVVTCTAAGALIGTSIGYGLGRFAPGYYRSVFRNGNAPDFDPLQVGIGLGLTQGLALGFLTGIAIAFARGLRRKRIRPS